MAVRNWKVQIEAPELVLSEFGREVFVGGYGGSNLGSCSVFNCSIIANLADDESIVVKYCWYFLEMVRHKYVRINELYR